MVTRTTVVLLALFGATLACSTTWPNGTDTHTSWFQCNKGPITFYNATPYDAKGKLDSFSVETTKFVL